MDVLRLIQMMSANPASMKNKMESNSIFIWTLQLRIVLTIRVSEKSVIVWNTQATLAKHVTIL